MKKLFLVTLLCLASTALLIAGGQKESGRSTAASIAQSEKIVEAEYIDTSSFINSYAFPYKAHEEDEISVYLFNNNITYLTSGGSQAIVLGLRANTPSFFDSRDCNYIVYIQNPAFLETERSYQVFETSLINMFDAKTDASQIGLFSAQNGKILFINSKEKINDALLEIEEETKNMEYLKTAANAFSAITSQMNNNPWRFIWVTDENVLHDASTLSSFTVLQNMYNTKNISFSLLCYGTSPQWGSINKNLTGLKGNSYYGKTYQYLEKSLYNDFIQFSKPAISDIHLTIATSPWLGKNVQTEIELGDLGAGQSIMIQQDLNLPPFETMPLGEIEEPFTAANCYLTYFSHKENKNKYTKLSVNALYTDSIDEWAQSIHPIAQKYSTLANTGDALHTMGTYFKLGNYAKAFQSLNSQLSALKNLDPNNTDVLISADIQLLEQTHSILFSQVQPLLFDE